MVQEETDRQRTEADLPLEEGEMKTYVFRVVIEPDEDVFTAYCPALKGCVTWGKTEAEALKNVRDAVEAYVEDMIKAGESHGNKKYT